MTYITKFVDVTGIVSSSERKYLVRIHPKADQENTLKSFGMLSLVSQYVEIFNDNGSLVEGLHVQRVHPNDKSIVSCEGCTEAVAPSKGHVPGKIDWCADCFQCSLTTFSHHPHASAGGATWPVHMYASRRIRSLARYIPDTYIGCGRHDSAKSRETCVKEMGCYILQVYAWPCLSCLNTDMNTIFLNSG